MRVAASGSRVSVTRLLCWRIKVQYRSKGVTQGYKGSEGATVLKGETACVCWGKGKQKGEEGRGRDRVQGRECVQRNGKEKEEGERGKDSVCVGEGATGRRGKENKGWAVFKGNVSVYGEGEGKEETKRRNRTNCHYSRDVR